MKKLCNNLYLQIDHIFYIYKLILIMKKMATNINKILVIGDISVDTNVYQGIRKSPEVKNYGTLIKKTKGGSFLLYETISKTISLQLAEINNILLKKEKEIEKEKLLGKSEKLEGMEYGLKTLDDEKLKWENALCNYGVKEEIFDAENFPTTLESYATWSVKEYVIPKSFKIIYGDKNKAWKVSDMLGWGNAKEPSNFEYNKWILPQEQYPDILVFDDGGNNFRNDEKAWGDLLFEKTEENIRKPRNISQIILKTAFPLGKGNLFHSVSKEFRKKLTIVTSIDEIRMEDVLISKGVSWEQTALDLVSELKHNKSIKQLLNCKRLIVTFQSEGALYIETGDNNDIKKCRLIFDPEHLEGDWVKAGKIEGDVFGLMSCFTAAVTFGIQGAYVKSIIENKSIDEKINLESLITSGLSAMRRYRIIGHGKDESNPEFPFESICSEIVSPHSQFASAFVPIPVENQSTVDYRNQNWTILEGNYKSSINIKSKPLFDTALRFALFGDKELFNTPFLKINFLTTFDRGEIESLRNIRNLITDYIAEEKPEKPLSLAVFGMPGSGKSFAVKQLAKSLGRPFLEFNLSQFADGELEGAFHRVRDEVLSGDTPIVFWDEFDSQAYKWLQYLLAPMQDGKFQEGQITHPIGKSIFIFAGGTSYTFETFGIQKPIEPQSNDPIAIKNYEVILNSYNDFILKKGPDFKSRLSGYLNIQGPNQLEKLDEVGKIIKDKNGIVLYNEEDIQYPVRRALFIRGICGKRGNDILNIDFGLLNALIKTRKFTHGSRSLEKILLYLKTKNTDKLQRSNLPTNNILNMLVENDFLSHLEEDKFFDFQSYKIAPQIHNNWMKIGDTQGWKLEYHKDYNLLPAHIKEDNIAAARRIQKVLDALKPEFNLKIVPKGEVEFYEKVNFDEILKNQIRMEKMAIEEHKGWVKTKQLAGWKYSNVRNDDWKLHNCMLEWESDKPTQLPEKEQKKDINAVSYFAEILKEAGFVIVNEKS